MITTKFKFSNAAFLLVCCILLFRSVNAQEVVKIAAIFGMTGREAGGWQNDAILGVRTAVQEWNEKHSDLLGKKIQINVYDNQSDKLRAAEMVKQAKEDGAVFAIGSRWSGITFAMAIEAQKLKLPLITPSASNKEITEIGDHIFRISWTSFYPAKALAWFANQHFKGNIAVICLPVMAGQSSIGSIFIDEFQAFRPNAQILKLEVDYDQVDFEPQLRQIEAAKSEIVFFAANRAELVFLQAEKLGFMFNWLVDDRVGPKTISSSLQSNTIFAAAMYFPDIHNRRLQQTIRKGEILAGELGLEPKNIKTSDVFPLSYDATYLALTSIAKAERLDSTAIVAALSATEYEGITGKISFDINRNPKRDVYIMKASPKETSFVFQRKIQLHDEQNTIEEILLK
ncbi:ABC transporter substrate-binding protein [bacterium]|nr:ABC transporter substrate-binding protein [bacterium]